MQQEKMNQFNSAFEAFHDAMKSLVFNVPQQPQAGEGKGCFVQKPPQPALEGFIAVNSQAIEKQLQETFDTARALNEKLRMVGYYEAPTPEHEEIKELLDRMERNRDGRNGFAVQVDLLYDMARLNKILVTQAFNHINHLF